VVNVNPIFAKFFSLTWPTRYLPSGFYKFIDILNNHNLVNFFLRKNKIFNKSRYSRNRQLYRTGVYMCLYINVIFVYFYIFAFYRFAFVFGFLWIGVGLLLVSSTLGRAMKYRFYNPARFFKEICTFIAWSHLLVSNLFCPLKTFVKTQYEDMWNMSVIWINLETIFPIIKSAQVRLRDKARLLKLEQLWLQHFAAMDLYLAYLSRRWSRDFPPLWRIAMPMVVRIKNILKKKQQKTRLTENHIKLVLRLVAFWRMRGL
jgi:hypothetical protein